MLWRSKIYKAARLKKFPKAAQRILKSIKVWKDKRKMKNLLLLRRKLNNLLLILLGIQELKKLEDFRRG